jgi:hypothetical protein
MTNEKIKPANWEIYPAGGSKTLLFGKDLTLLIRRVNLTCILYPFDSMNNSYRDLKKINWVIIFISVGLMLAIMVLLLLSF